jgi:hypothetical protein
MMFDWRPPEMNLWSLASIDYEQYGIGRTCGMSRGHGSGPRNNLAAV